MRLARYVAVGLAFALPLRAAEIAHGDLAIRGLLLEVDRTPVATAADIAASVQTIFGGKTNDDVPATPDLSAAGELSGPGIDTPITLVTAPGHRFQLPPLHQLGDYVLQNIRLTGADGHFIQQAVPSFVSITVTDVFKTSLKVRQLTPDELRARGINVDSRNFDVFEDRRRIDVLSVAGAACTFPSGLHSIDVEVNVRDAVPMLAGAGSVCSGFVLAERAAGTRVDFNYYSFGNFLPSTSHGLDLYRRAAESRSMRLRGIQDRARREQVPAGLPSAAEYNAHPLLRTILGQQ